MSIANQEVERARGTAKHNRPVTEARRTERTPDLELIAFAWTALQIICIIAKEDAEVIAGKRKAVRQRQIRKAWHAVMRPHFGPDAGLAEDLAEIRSKLADLDEDNPSHLIEIAGLKSRRAMLSAEARGRNWMLASISGLIRDTVEDDQADMARWAERSPLIAEGLDEFRDMIEPLQSLMFKMKDDAFFDECAYEAEQDRKPSPKQAAINRIAASRTDVSAETKRFHLAFERKRKAENLDREIRICRRVIEEGEKQGAPKSARDELPSAKALLDKLLSEARAL